MILKAPAQFPCFSKDDALRLRQEQGPEHDVHDKDSFDYWLTPPDPVPKGWYQRRGFALERIISRILLTEGLEPKTHIRPSGEEIDGSFLYAERTFLLEAKWKAEPVPASDFYAFKGKVDGKLVGTIGVFVSMSGFSPDAVDALKFGKEINLILFNGSDFQLVAQGHLTFIAALRKKLRYAAEEGQPFLPLSAGPDAAAAAATATSAPAGNAASFRTGLANIIVEGAADQEALQILLGRVDSGIAAATRVWPAGGQLNVASLLRQLHSAGAPGLAAVIESDMPVERLAEVHDMLSTMGGYLLVLTPTLEEVLENACDVDYINLVPPTGNKMKAARRVARNADIERLMSQNRDFEKLMDWLRGTVARGKG